jgi:hypothetical protein
MERWRRHNLGSGKYLVGMFECWCTMMVSRGKRVWSFLPRLALFGEGCAKWLGMFGIWSPPPPRLATGRGWLFDSSGVCLGVPLRFSEGDGLMFI